MKVALRSIQRNFFDSWHLGGGFPDLKTDSDLEEAFNSFVKKKTETINRVIETNIKTLMTDYLCSLNLDYDHKTKQYEIYSPTSLDNIVTFTENDLKKAREK